MSSLLDWWVGPDSSQQPPDDHGFKPLTIPSGVIPGSIVAEGAANIIVRFETCIASDEYHSRGESRNPLPAEYIPRQENRERDLEQVWKKKRGHLLRLRKKLPHINAVVYNYALYVKYIKSLFEDEQLLHFELVNLSGTSIIKKVNERLKKSEAVQAHTNGTNGTNGADTFFCRVEKRKGVYLANDPFGILLDDMTAPPGALLVEFKPKWLRQSPNAPTGSRRCRNCAKRARDNALHGMSGIKNAFCPLQLNSKDIKILQEVARTILDISPVHNESEETKIRGLAEILLNNPVLSRLSELQQTLDPHGVLDTRPKDHRFLIAMTLRDCSLFIQLPDSSRGITPIPKPIVKLGDLDMKSGLKADYWKNLENSLIEEGWYMGTEKAELKQPLDCHLHTAYFEDHPRF